MDVDSNQDLAVQYGVKAEIHEYVLKNWKIVKIATTKAQRKLFFNLRSKKKGLGWLTEEEVELMAKDLGVKPSEVREMEKRNKKKLKKKKVSLIG